MALKWEPTAFKNPLARARGLGNGHGALHHWVMLRMTSLGLLVLGIWALWSLLSMSSLSYAEFQDWIAFLPNAVLLGLFVLGAFYHATLGLQVVIEDYIHCEAVKIASLFGLRLVTFALAATAIFSILKLAL